MKRKLVLILGVSILVIFLSYYLYSLNNKIEKYENKISNLTDKIKYYDTQNKERQYDCSFTKTHKIVDIIDYRFALDGVSYAIVEDFQTYQPYIVIIPKNMENELKINTYYEFKYTLKGKGKINNFDDINSYLIGSLFNQGEGINSIGTIYINLELKESTKSGLEQIQENICQ